MALKIHEREQRGAPSYLFMPTYNCNLRCSYCFQDHMRTDRSFRHRLRTMTEETVDRIFTGILHLEKEIHGMSGNAEMRNIGFFGGEPLLTANRRIVECIIGKALKIGKASFWAVSNATELEAYEDILSPESIGSIQVTLNGPPAEHDQRRIYPDGSGSFARIARNITMALERGVHISVRMNIDRNNIGQLPQLAEEIEAQGWHKHSNFSAYTAPIRASNENVARSHTLDSWELDQALSAMRKEFSALAVIDRPEDDFKSRARRIFHSSGGDKPALQASFCAAHSRMYIFDAFADIYACWEKTGDKSIRIGAVKEDGTVILNAPQMALWRSRTVASNPVCSKCRYALHCGGGYAVLAANKSGKYHMNYCDGFGSLFRAAIAEAYTDHMAGVPMSRGAGRVCDL